MLTVKDKFADIFGVLVLVTVNLQFIGKVKMLFPVRNTPQ